MTIDEFNKGFKLLLGYYPNTKANKELANLYFAGLAELTAEEFNYAIGKIVKEYESDFIPKVPTILKYAQKGSLENQLILAKKMLQTAIRRNGSSGMIAFEDKGIHAVIDSVGWRRLCMMSVEESDNFFNWQFEGIYKNFMLNPYETVEYYSGTNRIFGQTKPKLITYKSIGVNNQNLKFIPLEYNYAKNQQIGFNTDMKEIKNKMLLGEK